MVHIFMPWNVVLNLWMQCNSEGLFCQDQQQSSSKFGSKITSTMFSDYLIFLGQLSPYQGPHLLFTYLEEAGYDVTP